MSAPAAGWRNRIVGEALVAASDLRANPKNWRTHSKAQRAALDGVLDEVGWVQRVMVNQRSGLIMDGHARVEQAAARGESVPVVYVDLSEQEEALVLATFDPLGAMASVDAKALCLLSVDIAQLQCAELDALVHSAANNGKPDVQAVLAGLEYRVIVDCIGEGHQAELLERFDAEGLRCRPLIS
jgi:hypothetical protein